MSLLSSLGVGNATVDLVLPSATVTAGEDVEATVEVDGGDDAQYVEEIYGAVRTQYLTPETIHDHTLVEFRLVEAGFEVGAGEHREFPVTVEMPPDTPVTWGAGKVWVDTGLDIDWAVDPEDKDELRVKPGPRLDAIHEAFGSLGFGLESADPVAAADAPIGDDPYVQQFRYTPRAEEFTALVDDVELLIDPDPGTDADAVEYFMEVDSEGDPMTDWSSTDEHGLRRTDTATDPGTYEDLFEETIRKFA